MAPFSKGYNAENAWQFITEFPGKGWTTRSLDRLLVKLRKFATPTGDRAAADRAVHVLMKTLTCIIVGMQFERR